MTSSSPQGRSPHHRPMSISPRSPNSSSSHVALQIANDLATIRFLENTKKGRVKYDTGWDRAPHSFLKLVSEVQQQTDYSKSRILERAWQITARDKAKEQAKQREANQNVRRSFGITDDDLENDSNNGYDNEEDNSSCSSSTVNEYYNNDYYESASASTSRTETPQPPSTQQSPQAQPPLTSPIQKHVRFLDMDGSLYQTPPRTVTDSTTSPGIPIISPSSGLVFPVRRVTQQISSQQQQQPLDLSKLQKSLQKTQNQGPKSPVQVSLEMVQRSKPFLGNILKRGLGVRDEEYDDEENAIGFLQDSLVYVSAEEALATINQQYREEAEERINRRRRVFFTSLPQQSSYNKAKNIQVEIYQKICPAPENREAIAIANEKERRRNERLRQTIQEGKKEMEALKLKQQIEREEHEKLKLANEAERKKIHQEFQKRMEEAQAAQAAAVQAAAAKAQEEIERQERQKKAQEVEEANRQQEKDAAIKAEEVKTAQVQAQAKAAIVKIPGQSQGYEVPPEFQGYILPPDLQRYLKSQQLLADYKEKFTHISATTTKDYYCSALKAVNTTLNSIANSPEHIRMKVTHLLNLLQGKPVSLGEASNAGHFVSTGLPQGELFVSNLLAFRFVKKSESEISKGHTSVEPLALLGVAVARNFPDWAVLVRANFYKMCPFLVPFSFPRNELSVEDYALAMGHDLKGTESAVRQALLDKMTGYVTLYTLMVKIFERQGITDFGESAEFFSLREVWRILVTTMTLKPQLDMTATTLQILLENLGDRLSALFGIQFKKLIQFLLQTYLPQIRKETPAGKTAALTRLELFLEKKLQKGF